MNKISVENYITGLMEAENREEYVKSHIVDNYLPFETKCAICDNIIKVCSYNKIGEGKNEITFFKSDSRGRYLFFILELIRNYTDIEVTFKDGVHLHIYNELQRHGVINEILSFINPVEVEEMHTLLNMAWDDVMENERSLAGYLDSKFAGFGLFAKSGLDVLNKFMDKLASDDKLMDKIKNKIEKAVK